MHQRCEKGCEILKGHAFCGMHGLKAQAGDGADLHKACTASCGRTDLLKSDPFCGGCGSKQDGGTEEFGQLLKSVQEYAAARADLIDADLTTFPALDEDALAASGGEMLKSLPAHVEDGEVSIDSMPLVQALLASSNRTAATIEARTTHLLKAFGQLAERMGERTHMLLKANAAQAEKIAELEERIATFGGQPRTPNKLAPAAGVLVKAVPGAGAPAVQDRKDLHGPALLLKAEAIPYDDGGLSSKEVELLRTITDQGGGLPELAAVGQSTLAHKVQGILARATH